MARKKQKEQTEPAADQGDAYEPVAGEHVGGVDFPPAEEPAVNRAAVAAEPAKAEGQAPLDTGRKASYRPRPVITEVIRDAKTGAVTKAHYIDGYNSAAGIGISFEFPTEDERPSEAVKQPLKEERQYGSRTQKGMTFRGDLKPKRWRKGLGDNPLAVRLETEGRFADAVAKLREEKEGREPDGGIPR